MSMFCSHDWAPRTGMDSGSCCQRCSAVSDKDCIPGSGLSEGRLGKDSYRASQPTAPTKSSYVSRLRQAFGPLF